jgi:hypothetical protein
MFGPVGLSSALGRYFAMDTGDRAELERLR